MPWKYTEQHPIVILLRMRDRSREYAESVRSQASGSATDPLYSGRHLQDVADYLMRPVDALRRASVYEPEQPQHAPFVWLYDLRAREFPEVKSFSKVATYEKALDENRAPYAAGLLFLTGYPSAEWLNALGGEYDFDPLYLLEHLPFLPNLKFSYALPAIPTASRNIIRLTLPTIGHVEPEIKLLEPDRLLEVRQQCSAKALHNLKEGGRAGHGHSGKPIVRRFHVHDSNSFTFEQDVTISFVNEHNRWTVVIWSDTGGGIDPEIVLANSPELPEYQNCQMILVPIVQDSRRRAWMAAPGEKQEGSVDPAHTLAKVPGNYGRLLDGRLVGQDAFYTILELLDLYAAAESQFVNMISQLLVDHFDRARKEANEPEPILADFQHTKDLLEQHNIRLRDVLAVLDDRDSFWPRTDSQELNSLAKGEEQLLCNKFVYLRERVQELLSKCDRGSDIVLNNANARLAKRSFDHNQDLGRITALGTLLAIVYVPWSFVTSIFGMNFAELGQGDLSIWIWGAVSVPVLLLSFVALYWIYGRPRKNSLE